MISQSGNIYSIDREVPHKIKGRKQKIKGKIIRQRKNANGYIHLTLFDCNQKCHHKSLHRLLAENFIPNPENKLQVNHRDGNKLNNQISNLEWVTQSENITHAFKLGLMPKGSKHFNSKLDEIKVSEIRSLKNLSTHEIAKIYNVAASTIGKILLKKSWKHVI